MLADKFASVYKEVSDFIFDVYAGCAQEEVAGEDPTGDVYSLEICDGLELEVAASFWNTSTDQFEGTSVELTFSYVTGDDDTDKMLIPWYLSESHVPGPYWLASEVYETLKRLANDTDGEEVILEYLIKRERAALESVAGIATKTERARRRI